MNAFDVLLILCAGAGLGLLCKALLDNLKATGKVQPAITATEAQLAALGQQITHGEQQLHARFDQFEATYVQPDIEKVKKMLSDALNELKAAADAKEAAAVAAATAAAAAPAAAQQEATDEQAVRDFTAANFPAPAQPAEG